MANNSSTEDTTKNYCGTGINKRFLTGCRRVGLSRPRKSVSTNQISFSSVSKAPEPLETDNNATSSSSIVLKRKLDLNQQENTSTLIEKYTAINSESSLEKTDTSNDPIQCENEQYGTKCDKIIKDKTLNSNDKVESIQTSSESSSSENVQLPSEKLTITKEESQVKQVKKKIKLDKLKNTEKKSKSIHESTTFNDDDDDDYFDFDVTPKPNKRKKHPLKTGEKTIKSPNKLDKKTIISKTKSDHNSSISLDSSFTIIIDDDDDDFQLASISKDQKVEYEKLQKLVNDMQKEIKEKTKVLDKLKHAQQYRKLNKLETLKRMSNTWMGVCNNAFNDLLMKLRQQDSLMDRETLLNKLRLPENISEKIE